MDSKLQSDNLCRTCLSHESCMRSVFSQEEMFDQVATLADMLMACTSILVIKEDGLPENICNNCSVELHRAYLFKKMSEKSDNTLRSSLMQAMPRTNETEMYSLFQMKELQTADNLSAEIICKDEISTTNFDIDKSIPFSPVPIIDDISELDNDEVSENDRKIRVRKKPEVQNESNPRKRQAYHCEECNEECLGLASYWKHMAKIHGRTFKCDDCGKEFKSQIVLEKHKTAQHSDTEKPKRTKSKTGIKRNLPRTCEICNKTFRFHSNLERHKLIHTGEKPYLCNVCGKGFGQMSYLKIHSFIHTGEKPYKCQMCDKSFAAPGTLMTHIRIHTGERPHVCKICGKDFPQSGYLSAHIRTHTGEKPVECKVCHRRFNQSGRLVIHMRIHSGEKPYSCKECGRSFAVKGTLKKHIRTHTGERPYVCSVCGQAFGQSGTLATHMKVHRPKQ